jgi:hypothetical protein
VQTVFNVPVIPDGLGDIWGVISETEDRIGGFGGGFSVDLPLAGNLVEGFKPGQEVFSREPVEGCHRVGLGLGREALDPR